MLKKFMKKLFEIYVNLDIFLECWHFLQYFLENLKVKSFYIFKLNGVMFPKISMFHQIF